MAYGDLQLRALGVELLARGASVHAAASVRLTTHSGHGVKSDSLKADQVVAAGDARGDRGRPRRVVVDHLAGAPEAVVDGAAQQTSLVDLEPLERGRVHSRARRARALREVRQLCWGWDCPVSANAGSAGDRFGKQAHHGAVGVRPDLVPVRGDRVARLSVRSELECARSAVVVAGDGGVSRVSDRVAEPRDIPYQLQCVSETRVRTRCPTGAEWWSGHRGSCKAGEKRRVSSESKSKFHERDPLGKREESWSKEGEVRSTSYSPSSPGRYGPRSRTRAHHRVRGRWGAPQRRGRRE